MGDCNRLTIIRISVTSPSANPQPTTQVWQAARPASRYESVESASTLPRVHRRDHRRDHSRVHRRVTSRTTRHRTSGCTGLQRYLPSQVAGAVVTLPVASTSGRLIENIVSGVTTA